MIKDSAYGSLKSNGQAENRLAKPPPEEPDALIAHVRVCEGDGPKGPSLLGTKHNSAIGITAGLFVSYNFASIVRLFIALMLRYSVTPTLRHVIAPIFAFFLFSVMVNAATHYVVTNGTPGHLGAVDPYTNWAWAGTNIIDVVNAALTNSVERVVWVSNGTYYLTNQININGALTLQGFNGRTNTFIDGNRTGGNTNRCFYINHASAIVKGFTISNGGNAMANGGGVYCDNGKLDDCTIKLNIAGNGGGVWMKDGMLTNCLVIANKAYVVSWDAGGGGVFVRLGTAPCLYNCDIISNLSLGYGGGIYLYVSPATIRGCNVLNNYAVADGGGIYSFNNQNKSGIRDSVISYNYAIGSGGGVFSDGDNITNCIICYNSSAGSQGAGGIYMYNIANVYNCLIYSNNSTGDGAARGGGGVRARGGLTIANCTIAKNGSIIGASGLSCTNAIASTIIINTIVYSNSFCDGTNQFKAVFTNSCLESTNGLNVSSCITNNPLFVNKDTGNFRLSRGSPCINAGLNQSWMTLDLDGHSRIDRLSGIVDMGCYEYLPSGTMFKFR